MRINIKKFYDINPNHCHGKDYIEQWNNNRFQYMTWDERRLEKLDLSEYKASSIMGCDRECIFNQVLKSMEPTKENKIKSFFTNIFSKIKIFINGYRKKK